MQQIRAVRGAGEMLRDDKKREGNFETAAKEIETRKEPARFCGVFTLHLTRLLESMSVARHVLSDYTAKFFAGRRSRKMTLLLFCPLPPFFYLWESAHMMFACDDWREYPKVKSDL